MRQLYLPEFKPISIWCCALAWKRLLILVLFAGMASGCGRGQAPPSSPSDENLGMAHRAASMQQPSGDTTDFQRLLSAARKAYESGDMRGAADAGTKALESAGMGQKVEVEQAACCFLVGAALGRMGQDEEALPKFQQAAAIYRTNPGNDQKQAICLKMIGVSLCRMQKYDAGVAQLQRAVEILDTVEGTARDRAECHSMIGDAMDDIGRHEDALADLHRALMIYMSIPGTEREQGNCYKMIGVTFRHMAKYEQAIESQDKAVALLKTIRGAERDTAGCYVNIGVALGELGRYEDAIARQEQALAVFSTIADAGHEQAGCYGNIGTALACLGEFRQARRRFEQALAIDERYPHTERQQAQCYANIGTALLNMGSYEEATSNYERAIALFKQTAGTDREQAECQRSLAAAFVDMGKGKEAIEECERALALCRRVAGSETCQAGCYGIIGRAHSRAGRLSEAVVAYGQASQLAPDWSVFRDLGKVYRQRGYPGDGQRAVDSLTKAWQIAELRRLFVVASEHRAAIFEEPSGVFSDLVSLLISLTDKNCEAAFHFTDRSKGRALEDTLQEKSALKAIRPDAKLLAEDRELSLQISKLTSLREPLPEADERRKKLTEDIDSLQQRRNMIEVELKKTALGGYVAPDFRKPIEMAKELEPDAAVLQYSVGEKEGWLLILTREGITAHKLGADTQALPELLPRQEATLDQLVEALKTRGKKIGLDGLVRLARTRAEDLGRRESERHNSISANLEKAILKRLAEVVMPEAALAELRKKGIHRLLVIPDGSLHYIPFAMLRLKNEKDEDTHYLVEEFASSYIPAMTTLDTIRKQKQEREKKRLMKRHSLLAFANPAYGTETATAAIAKDDMLTRVRDFRTDYYKGGGLRLTSLPETEQEATRVASLFAPPNVYSKLTADEPEGEAVVFMGRGAGEEQVKRLLGVAADAKAHRQWQYLLFSTHGLADTHNGMLSCLALSSPAPDSEEDGFLQAQEVMNLELDTDLVMLSACQTGLGRLRGGEGLVGLSAAFFYAGAESVCASLWQVPSGPTSQLVPELFKQLKEGKVDRAEALRQAQLTVMRQGQGRDGNSTDYSNPFCWAAFVMMGEYAGGR